MLLYCSIVDMLKLPQFKGMNEQQLLQRENDNVIMNLLYPVGVDKNKALVIQACKHRTNSGEVVVNWRYVFEERSDREHLWSGHASLEARIHSTKDTTLIGELSVMGQLFRVSTDGSGAVLKSNKNKDVDLLAHEEDEDVDMVVSQIEALQSIQKHIRGELMADENVLFNIQHRDIILQQDFKQMETQMGEEV